MAIRPPDPVPRIFAAEIGRLLRFIDRPELARELGLAPELLSDREAKVPIGVWYDVVEAATAASGDPYLGLHFGSRSHVSLRKEAGVMRLLILSSDTVRIAVDRALRYQSFWNEAERYEIEESEGHFSVRYGSWGPPRPAHVQLAEKMAAQSVRFVRAAVPECVPEAVRFPHARRPGSEEVARVLGREPSYGAPYTEISFRSPVIDAKLPTADTVLFQVLDRELALRIVEVTPASSFADRVRKAVADYLHREQLSIGTVARALATSERTLQRRLTEERTSFRDLVDEVRRSRALALLDAGASFPELAVHLGYPEEATLRRAFRRWTGASPETWRARQLADRATLSVT